MDWNPDDILFDVDRSGKFTELFQSLHYGHKSDRLHIPLLNSSFMYYN